MKSRIFAPSFLKTHNMNTIENFKAYVAKVEATEGYTKPLAFGLGIRRSKGDKVLDVNFPSINWDGAFGTAALLQDVVDFKGGANGFVTVSKNNYNKGLITLLLFMVKSKNTQILF